MIRKYDQNNKTKARKLRQNMTKQERHLWYDYLSRHHFRFYRQRQFGPYIVDFYCSRAKLVIEIDGSQHYQSDEMEYDKKRTEYLNSLGLTVIRFTNNDIDNNFEGVCSMIEDVVKNPSRQLR